MGLEQQHIDDDAVILETRIPESYRVVGLEYGAYVNRGVQGWCGYYVSLPGSDRWGVARLTPASDELVQPDEDCDDTPAGSAEQDRAIVRAIQQELEA